MRRTIVLRPYFFPWSFRALLFSLTSPSPQPIILAESQVRRRLQCTRIRLLLLVQFVSSQRW